MDQKNLDIYGSKPIPWSRALEQLEAATAKTGVVAHKTYWLATVRPDGRPHIAGVGALWVDGSFYFTSGAGTRKSRNLAKNPNCVISLSLPGLDLVVEGTARKVTDEPTLRRLAKLYAAQGWPASVSDGALTAEYSAPSAGPAPWDLYFVTPSTAFGVATAEPYGATRWRFGARQPASGDDRI
jgi:general stress protein 26